MSEVYHGPWAGRYEVAVDTPLELKGQGVRLLPIRPTEPVSVWFERRRFTWWPGTDEKRAVVSVMIRDSNDYSAERAATYRFLSAIAYRTGVEIRIEDETASGYKKEFDSALIHSGFSGAFVHPVPPELIVTSNDDLLQCLGLFREALSSHSPALAYLSYWKIIELATGGAPRHKEWMIAASADLAEPWVRDSGSDEEKGRTPDQWFEHFLDTRRAAAHAIPWSQFRHHPDDPDIHRRLTVDSARMGQLAKRALDERWPKAVRDNDPPKEWLGRGMVWPPPRP